MDKTIEWSERAERWHDSAHFFTSFCDCREISCILKHWTN